MSRRKQGAGATGPWLPTLWRHMTENEIRAYARNAGLGPEEAAPWADALVGPFETGRALRDGRSIEDVLAARIDRDRFEEWKRWGFTIDEAAPWHELGWRPPAALEWSTAGVPADVATAWARPSDGLRAFSVDEFTRFASVGRTPDEVRAGRHRIVGPVPIDRRLVWARWNGWFVVGAAERVLDVARRRVHQRRIRSAHDSTVLQSTVPVDALEREIGPLLDEWWLHGYLPSPGQDLVPRRPTGWMPAALPGRVGECLEHPLDMLSAPLPFDVALLRHDGGTGWDCLWRRANDVVELGALARSHGFDLRHHPLLVGRALGAGR